MFMSGHRNVDDDSVWTQSGCTLVTDPARERMEKVKQKVKAEWEYMCEHTPEEEWAWRDLFFELKVKQKRAMRAHCGQSADCDSSDTDPDAPDPDDPDQDVAAMKRSVHKLRQHEKAYKRARMAHETARAKTKGAKHDLWDAEAHLRGAESNELQVLEVLQQTEQAVIATKREMVRFYGKRPRPSSGH